MDSTTTSRVQVRVYINIKRKDGTKEKEHNCRMKNITARRLFAELMIDRDIDGNIDPDRESQRRPKQPNSTNATELWVEVADVAGFRKLHDAPLVDDGKNYTVYVGGIKHKNKKTGAKK